MHRQIMEAVAPYGLLLLACCVGLWLTVRLSGARWNGGMLRRLHGCERGSVQSLSFVLTLPIFIMLMLFILQVSQLMIAVGVVHYAAFAATRAAIVWIPAEVEGAVSGRGYEPQNVVIGAAADGAPIIAWETETWRLREPLTQGAMSDTYSASSKLQEVWTAAVMALAPIAPSRDLYATAPTSTLSSTAQTAYRALAPTAWGAAPRLPARIANKLAYTAENTAVYLEGIDKDSLGYRDGLRKWSYNPRDHDVPRIREQWDARQVGWQDAVTATVVHKFALLPGPGRLLLQPLADPNGRTPDRVSRRIEVLSGYRERVYATQLSASATLTLEGLKSVRPYVHPGE